MRVVEGIYRAGEGNNVAELLIRPDFVKCFRVLRSMTCAKQEVWCISRRGLRLAVTDADDLRYLFCTGGPSL
jgi:hypothetical protein